MKLLAKRQLENFANAKCSETVCASCNLYDDCIDGYIDVIAQTALALAKMLERLEWGNRIPRMNYLPVYEHHCPLCGWHEFNGHAPNCELGNMLNGLEGE